MTNKEIYENIDSAIASYKPCFCATSSRKYVKRFFDSHYEVWSSYQWLEINGEKVYLDQLKDVDIDAYTKYYNRWMKRATDIIMPYIQECIARKEEEAKTKKDKGTKDIKRKTKDSTVTKKKMTKKKTTKKK